MTLIITPAVSAAPEAPAPASAPANDARSQPQRAATFGPALSDARDRLASPDARRSGSPNRRPTQSEQQGRPDRSASPVDRSGGSRTDAADQNTAVDEASEGDLVEADTTAASVSEDVAPEEVAPADVAPEDAAPPTGNAPESLAPSAAEAAMAATLLPTAKGKAGDDDLSIEPSIETVVSPDSVREADVVALSVIDDGVTAVDMDTITSPIASAPDEAVGETGRQAALTSLENVSDVNLELAERIQTATTEEVAGPAISAGDATRADPLAELSSSDVTRDAPIQGRVQEQMTGRPIGTEAAAAASVDETSNEIGTVTADQPAVEAEVADRPVQHTAINTVNRTNTPDSVVVLAREATVAADSAKATPSNATQTTGPMQTAEANLWEDVRSAFDRIRSTGDGQEVRIRLRPAELGELLVQIRTKGDHVAVRLVASSAAAQQTLVDDRLRLAAELARAGFEEGSVDISQQDAGDAGGRGRQNSDGSDTDRSGRSIGTAGGASGLATTRDIFERREPIRTDSGFRPGRSVQSTINLTL